MNWKKSLHVLEALYCRYEDDEVTALGAQMTYYVILAFFPFLIFLLTIVGLTPISTEDVWGQLALVLPESSYKAVNDIMNEIFENRNEALLSFSMIGTLWAASNGLSAMIKGLNKAYDEPETRPFWKLKGLAVLFTVGLALIMLLTFGLLVFGHVIGVQLFKFLGYPDDFELLWGLIKFVIPLTAMLMGFALLYWVAPNRRLRFKSVIPGAVFASLGWIAISLLFSFYVSHFGNFAKSYGSLGGIIVLLVWLYFSCIIILIGGEVNATLTFDREGKSKPGCKSFSSRLTFWKKKGKV